MLMVPEPQFFLSFLAVVYCSCMIHFLLLSRGCCLLRSCREVLRGVVTSVLPKAGCPADRSGLASGVGFVLLDSTVTAWSGASGRGIRVALTLLLLQILPMLLPGSGEPHLLQLSHLDLGALVGLDHPLEARRF